MVIIQKKAFRRKLFLIVHDFQNLDIEENKTDQFISKMKNLENAINF